MLSSEYLLTALQLDCENVDRRANDSSAGFYGVPWGSGASATPLPTVNFETAAPLYGSASLKVTPALGGANLRTTRLNRFTPDGLDWTFEISMKLTGAGLSTSGWQSIIFWVTNWTGGTAELLISLWINTARTALQYQWRNNGTTYTYTLSYSFSLNTQYDIALCRQGSSLYWLINGTLLQTDTGLVTQTRPSNVSDPCIMLGELTSFNYTLQGLLDNFRYTCGLAKWTASYTVSGIFETLPLPLVARRFDVPQRTAQLGTPPVQFALGNYDRVRGGRDVVSLRYFTTYESNFLVQPSSNKSEISGIVTIQGTVAARKVRLYNKSTGVLVAQVMSGANGAYKFINLDPSFEYFAVSHDYTRSFNAVIQDMIQP